MRIVKYKYAVCVIEKIALTCASILVMQSCGPISKKNGITTGVEEIHNQDGSTIIVATARASEQSIRKGKVSMMRTTSCDAAKILLIDKVKKVKPSIKNELSFNEMELLEKGKYCRIRIQIAK